MNQNMVRGVAILTLVVVLFSSCGGSASLEKGHHVRLSAPQEDVAQMTGIVHRVERDHLLIQADDEDETRTIPRRSITSLEIGSRSRKTGTVAIIGALSLGIIGAAAVKAEDCDPYPAACRLGAGLLLMVPGALLGALLGAFIRGEETWKPVPLETIHP